MKKFILFVMLTFFAIMPVQATQIFYFNGQPSHYSVGPGMTRSINNFGSNAIFSPKGRYQASINAHRYRHMKHMASRRYARPYGYNRYSRPYGYGRYSYPYDYSAGNNIQNTPKPKTVSRLSKDYKIVSSGKSYVRNGVVYYE